MEAVIVGPHALSGEEGLEPVGGINIKFPLSKNACKGWVLKMIKDAARPNDAALIFQEMPAQLAMAIAEIMGDGDNGRPKIGVIILNLDADKTFSHVEWFK